ncbi:MAG: nitronate monooxygenase [Sphingomonadaceae bacterium]|nr:nitronate monooxygenase [Sphingomonadaceae bacterium]
METAAIDRPFAGNRVVRDCGARYPIFQSPMGWLGRSRLAAAVSNAGGLGILETSSGEFDAVKREILAMPGLTDAPYAVNLPLHFLKHDDSIVDWVIERGIRFVTTSAGDPAKYAERLKRAGITVYHAVPSLEGARKAAAAGVDGLVVEGGESGAFRSPKEIGVFTLLQAVRAATDLPIVAAGGVVDGRGMAAAFALGAEGVQMGTRFVASAENPASAAYKAAIVAAGEHDTTVTNRGVGPCVRALKGVATEAIAAGRLTVPEALQETKSPYFDGDMSRGLAPAGESSALIDEVLPCDVIVRRTIESFWREIDRLAALVTPRAAVAEVA